MASVSEASDVIDGLRAEMARHKLTLQKVESRRRRNAFKASQREPAATSALAKAEADEVVANARLRNLALALDEAKARLSDAQAREHEQDQAETEAQADALGDELIASTHEIVAAIEQLRDLLQERGEIVEEILQTGVLGEVSSGLLARIEPVSEAIVGELAPHFNGRVSGSDCAHFLEQTFEALGRQPPERELTIVEENLLNGLQPTQLGAI